MTRGPMAEPRNVDRRRPPSQEGHTWVCVCVRGFCGRVSVCVCVGDNCLENTIEKKLQHVLAQKLKME